MVPNAPTQGQHWLPLAKLWTCAARWRRRRARGCRIQRRAVGQVNFHAREEGTIFGCVFTGTWVVAVIGEERGSQLGIAVILFGNGSIRVAWPSNMDIFAPCCHLWFGWGRGQRRSRWCRWCESNSRRRNHTAGKRTIRGGDRGDWARTSWSRRKSRRNRECGSHSRCGWLSTRRTRHGKNRNRPINDIIRDRCRSE